MSLLSPTQLSPINASLASEGVILLLGIGTPTGDSGQRFVIKHPSLSGSILLDYTPDTTFLEDSKERLRILDQSLKVLPLVWDWSKWKLIANRDAARTLSIPDLRSFAGLAPVPEPTPEPDPVPEPTPEPDPVPEPTPEPDPVPEPTPEQPENRIRIRAINYLG
jgi:predicted component of type VI protein secretion system